MRYVVVASVNTEQVVRGSNPRLGSVIGFFFEKSLSSSYVSVDLYSVDGFCGNVLTLRYTAFLERIRQLKRIGCTH